MTMPNFLVIGAQKSGTKSLYHYLGQHPEIYMSPITVPRFFALEGTSPDFFRGPGDREMSRRTITDIDSYKALFAAVSGEKAVGEASPIYLYLPETAERIRRYVPEAKLIAVLRNPVERAYEAYLTLVRDGRERLGFSEALEAEDERIKGNWHPVWHYRARGFYHPQLQRYYELFLRDRIRVYLYEDLKAKRVPTMQSIFRFLCVDDAFAPDTGVWYDDVPAISRNDAVHRFTDKPNRLKNVVKPLLSEGLRKRMSSNVRNRNLTRPPPMPARTREELAEAYREDVLKLQGLIGRDLSRWVSQEPVPA